MSGARVVLALGLAFASPGTAGADAFGPGDPRPDRLPLEEIQLPPGFTISLVTDRIPAARQMALGTRGTIFVGTRTSGRVWAARDEDGDGSAESVAPVLSGLRQPNGVAFRDGSLYVAEIHRVTRYDDIESRLDRPPAPVVVRDDLPTDEWHGWKFIAFGPDGKLYVPVGAPCNVCERDDARYASILRMNADGTDLEVFAKGIRNTVGFDWDPATGELWFTDNGRDELGENSPPDELNHAPRAGMHFGFPYCHGGDVVDPEFGRGRPCSSFTPPVQKLGAHVAALGMAFVRGEAFPEEYRGDVYIPEHGSWNRSRPNGYRLTRVVLDAGRAVSYEVFAAGWLREDGNEAWGRPVHVLETPAGGLLVSDDRAGAIYRIRWTGVTSRPGAE